MLKDFSMSDYDILAALYDNKCGSEVRAFTIKKLEELTNLSYSKIRRTLKAAQGYALVKEGAKNGLKKTYYLTQKGIEKMDQVYKGDYK